MDFSITKHITDLFVYIFQRLKPIVIFKKLCYNGYDIKNIFKEDDAMKRFLAFLLAFSLIAGALVACGPAKDENSEDTVDTQQKEENPICRKNFPISSVKHMRS